MSEKTNEGTRGAVLVLGGCFTTVVAVILILVIATIFFVDTTKCSSLGRAMPFLLGSAALVFLASVFVVRAIAWRIIGSKTGRWVTLAVYGAAMLVSFVLIALALLLVFNC